MMQPYVQKLLNNPGSCVVMVIEAPLNPDGPRLGKAWLSGREREGFGKRFRQSTNAAHRKGKLPRLNRQLIGEM